MAFQKKHVQLNTGRTYFKKGHVGYWKGKHRSKETKEKNRIAQTGKRSSDKTKKKQSKTMKKLFKEGKIKVWNKDLTKETDARVKEISKKIKDKVSTKEHRIKMSIAHKGQVAWNKDIKTGIIPKNAFEKKHIPWNKDTKGIMKSNSGSFKKGDTAHKGFHQSEKTKQKCREGRMKQRLPIHHTKPELEFMRICKKYNLPFKYVGDGQVWIGKLNPDFINIDGKKEVVEIFGEYWHSPVLRKNLRETATYEGRRKRFKEYGFDCKIIWENELKNEQLILDRFGGV